MQNKNSDKQMDRDDRTMVNNTFFCDSENENWWLNLELIILQSFKKRITQFLDLWVDSKYEGECWKCWNCQCAINDCDAQ